MEPTTIQPDRTALARLASRIALATSIATLITFSIAIATPPGAGPLCEGDCHTYPYHDIASRFPRDYWWMYAAMIQLLLFAALMVCLHLLAMPAKRFWSMMSLFFAFVSAATLFLDYFVQVSVVQQSLEHGEFEGIALISQFNPHGIFLALEDAGYLLMSFAMACAAPGIIREQAIGNWLRALFSAAMILTLTALVIVSIVHGIHREYIFEIAAISINWLILIAAGFMLPKYFRSTAKDARHLSQAS